MKRRIIEIDREKCTGCGLCVNACHEGAIGLENGKAVLLRDDYCDGLGDCLPTCPTNAISFVEREALPYDEAAVEQNKQTQGMTHTGGCPGSQMRSLSHGCPGSHTQTMTPCTMTAQDVPSRLTMWPVQIKLCAPNAPYFDGCDLLIAADCTAYAYGNFHAEFMQNRVTLIGCPKLDNIDYSEKLTAILLMNDVRSITLARMEVPCCGGMETAVRRAVEASGREIPITTTIITIDGQKR